ncbi:LacI family DNA-binding transcriptional regulator [Micrococcales bacterium 31B]|nr:LacI family DNA-binding transcriptional regulator [Micrococcales bacterium 31B]
MATIKDVACSAGVSIATVSRHIAGESVRRADDIARAIEALNYRPNESARGLRRGRTNLVGVIVPDISNPYFAAVIGGIESVCNAHGLRILIASSAESTDQELDLIGSLAPTVDGFVVVPVAESAASRSALVDAAVPVVLVDRTLGATQVFDQVRIDNARGSRAAARHLLDLGHTRVGVLSGPASALPGRERHDAFVAEFAAAGAPLDPSLVMHGDFTRTHGRNSMRNLLALAEPPTAVFAGNNLIAQGALQELRVREIEVPTHMSFIGFDDLDLAALLTPPLTVVARDTALEGQSAGELIVRRIAEPQRGLITEVLPVELIVRGSTGPAPGQHSLTHPQPTHR